MSNIAFLSTFFPTLSLTELHFMSLDDLEFALEQNLSKRDLKIVHEVWLLGDVENVRSYLKNEPMIKKGSLLPEQIISIFNHEERAPGWLKAYLKDFPSEEERIAHEYLLSRYCLKYSLKESPQEAVKDLLTLEFTSRKVLEKARNESQDSQKSFKNEQKEEKWLNEPVDTWPEEYQQLLQIWNSTKNSPIELEKEIAEWRFSALENRRENSSPFSLNRLIFSIALFDFIESRRPLTDETKKAPQERIIKAICNDSF